MGLCYSEIFPYAYRIHEAPAWGVPRTRHGVTAEKWEARIRRAGDWSPRKDYRALEAKIPPRLGMSRWFDEWARLNRPRTRRGAYDLGLTWQWVHVARAHLDLSPVWRGRTPTAKDRSRYRQFEKIPLRQPATRAHHAGGLVTG